MATGARRPAFDHARLASVLSTAADTTYDAAKLPFRDIAWVNGDRSIRFSVAKGKNWTCDVSSYSCTGPDTLPIEKASEVKSPDGEWIAFGRDGNLFVKQASGGGERQLTTDGTADWGYGLTNVTCCGQVTSVRSKTELRPLVSWSPDSKRLVATKWDQRGVRLMHLLETKNPGPILHSYRYALPGDSVIPRFDLYVFDVAGGRGVKVDFPTIDAVNTSWPSRRSTIDSSSRIDGSSSTTRMRDRVSAAGTRVSAGRVVSEDLSFTRPPAPAAARSP